MFSVLGATEGMNASAAAGGDMDGTAAALEIRMEETEESRTERGCWCVGESRRKETAAGVLEEMMEGIGIISKYTAVITSCCLMFLVSISF